MDLLEVPVVLTTFVTVESDIGCDQDSTKHLRSESNVCGLLGFLVLCQGCVVWI